jgi:hypothetical protein
VPGLDNEVLTSDGSGGIVAESNFTYNGSDSVLTLTGSYDKVNTKSVPNISTTTTIDTFGTDFGCSAIFEYCITNNSGYKRMGQVFSTWDNASAVFTDISSPDLNGLTTGLIWKVTVTSGSVELIANIGSGTWDILVATRIIF